RHEPRVPGAEAPAYCFNGSMGGLKSGRAYARRTARNLADGFVEDFEGRVGLGFRQDQGRREADRVAAGPEDQQALVEALLDDRVARVDGALLRLPVLDELDANHQALAADVADDLVLVHQRF